MSTLHFVVLTIAEPTLRKKGPVKAPATRRDLPAGDSFLEKETWLGSLDSFTKPSKYSNFSLLEIPKRIKTLLFTQFCTPEEQKTRTYHYV